MLANDMDVYFRPETLQKNQRIPQQQRNAFSAEDKINPGYLAGDEKLRLLEHGKVNDKLGGY